MKSKLTTKDLIGAGAFGAIYVVLLAVVSTILSMAPIAFLLTPLIMGIVGGTVYMVYVRRIQKTGAIMILAVLVGLATSNSTIYPFFIALIWGVLAEIVYKLRKNQGTTAIQLSYCVFNLTSIGPFFTIILAKQAFLDSCVMYYGQAYADTIDKYTPSWIALVFIAFAVVGALMGGKVGQRLLKKHFVKVGIVA